MKRSDASVAIVTMGTTAAAWVWTLSGSSRMLASLPGFVATWTVMMAAMMLPSLIPSIMLFRTVTRTRESFGFGPVPSGVFVAGYFAAWAALGAVVFLLGRLAPTGAGTQRLFMAAGLLVAGVYQLTPLKSRCLSHCRSPMHFLMHHWHDGPFGALRVGAHHGLYCIGCCWGLMIALIALGMMRPEWMGAMALVILAEKVLPGGERLARLVGLALIVAGVAAAAGVLPFSGPAMGGMDG